jgi:hypothetical protein
VLRIKNACAVVAVMAVCGLPNVTLGQGGSYGSIIGYVYDQTGNPVKGVKVSATSPTQIGGAKVAYSADDGAFRLRQLFPGTFEMRASAPKLKTVIQKDIKVGITSPAEVSLVMEVESGGVEEVKVIEKAPLVSTTTANIKQSFDLDFVEGLPHNSRDNIHNQMINNVGGAVGGRVRGGAGNQTIFTQDGFEMRGQFPVLKSSAAYEIQSGGYGADNATASGGLVNLVTKSGSNKFEFEFNATADMDELRFFTDQRDSRAGRFFYVINPVISGPIIKDRLWFHFATESHIIKTGRNPDAEGIFAEPQPYGKFIQKGTLKLTWQISARNKLTTLTNFDFPNEMNMRDGLGIEKEAQQFRMGQRYMQGIIWESLLTDSLIFRSQVGYIQIPQTFYPALCRSQPIDCDHIPAIVNVTNSRRTERQNNPDGHRRDDLYSLQVNNQLEWFVESKGLGEHNITLKDRFYTEQDIRRNSRPGNMLYENANDQPNFLTEYYSNDPRYEEPRYGWFIASHTLYRNLVTLADSWRPTRHLTMTPSLSYVWATGSNNRGDKLVDSTAFAPGLAGAWDATGDGRTVIRGSLSNYVDVNLEEVARHTLGSQASRKCTWNPDTMKYDRSCVFSGGLTKNTFGSPCGQSGLNPDGSDCKESLKIPRTWEYSIGGEREVVQGLAIGADFVYRKYNNQYEVNETNRIWDPSASIIQGFRNGRAETVNDLSTPDGAWRRYMGVTGTITKREGRLKTHVAYTWSKLNGNVFNGSSNAWGEKPGRDPYLTDISLPDDHRHEIKATVQWVATNFFSVGMLYNFTSGFPYNRNFRNDETGSFEDLRAGAGVNPGTNINDPADDRVLRLPDRNELGAQFRLSMLPLIGQKLDVYADVLNILAVRTPTGFTTDDGPAFGVERAWMDPFRIRLGVNFRY